jgi:hypothetical protein
MEIYPDLLRTIMIQTADERFQAVSLVHSSVRDYMDIELAHWNTHFEIASTCLRYLCLLDMPDALSSSDYRQRFPLADCAARFWYYHMERVDSSAGHLDRLLHAATEFLNSAGGIYLQNWVKLFDPDRPWLFKPDLSGRLPSVSTPLYYASWRGRTSLIRKLLEIGEASFPISLFGVAFKITFSTERAAKQIR